MTDFPNPLVPLPAPIYNYDDILFINRTPYISVSDFNAGATAIDTSNLVEGGDQSVQDQALYNKIAEASGYMDEYCNQVLAATVNQESTQAKVIGGKISLVCNYRPVLAVLAVSLGATPSTLSPVGSGQAQNIWVQDKIIKVPLQPVGTSFMGTQPGPWPAVASNSSEIFAVWAYVSGYPHTTLGAAVDVGDTTFVAGVPIPPIVPTYTQMVVYDTTGTSVMTETVNIESVSADGATVTIGAPGFRYAHTPPPIPDQITISALPPQFREACILVTCALIKIRGDGGLSLMDLKEPTEKEGGNPQAATDLALAEAIMDRTMVVNKMKR